MTIATAINFLAYYLNAFFKKEYKRFHACNCFTFHKAVVNFKNYDYRLLVEDLIQDRKIHLNTSHEKQAIAQLFKDLTTDDETFALILIATRATDASLSTKYTNAINIELINID